MQYLVLPNGWLPRRMLAGHLQLRNSSYLAALAAFFLLPCNSLVTRTASRSAPYRMTQTAVSNALRLLVPTVRLKENTARSNPSQYIQTAERALCRPPPSLRIFLTPSATKIRRGIIPPHTTETQPKAQLYFIAAYSPYPQALFIK